MLIAPFRVRSVKVAEYQERPVPGYLSRFPHHLVEIVLFLRGSAVRAHNKRFRHCQSFSNVPPPACARSRTGQLHAALWPRCFVQAPPCRAPSGPCRSRTPAGVVWHAFLATQSGLVSGLGFQCEVIVRCICYEFLCSSIGILSSVFPTILPSFIWALHLLRTFLGGHVCSRLML